MLHDYLGTALDFMKRGKVQIQMITKMLVSVDPGIRKCSETSRQKAMPAIEGRMPLLLIPCVFTGNFFVSANQRVIQIFHWDLHIYFVYITISHVGRS